MARCADELLVVYFFFSSFFFSLESQSAQTNWNSTQYSIKYILYSCFWKKNILFMVNIACMHDMYMFSNRIHNSHMPKIFLTGSQFNVFFFISFSTFFITIKYTTTQTNYSRTYMYTYALSFRRNEKKPNWVCVFVRTVRWVIWVCVYGFVEIMILVFNGL